MNTRISVCLIVKNEEKFISSCVESVLSVAWEIIFMDTGSTDKTIEIINYLQNKIDKRIFLFETKWEGDFAKARNECISKAKGDWILNIDADETLSIQTSKELLPFLAKQNFSLPVVYFFRYREPDSDDLTSIYYKATIFNNNRQIYYLNRIHEYPTHQDKIITINTDFEIINHEKERTNDELKAKYEKYLEILQNEPEENSPAERAYHYLHLGNAYSFLGKPGEAILYWEKARKEFKNTKEQHLYRVVCLKIIQSLIFTYNNLPKALKYIQYFPENDSPEILYFLACIFLKQGDRDSAKKIFRKILGPNLQDKTIFFSEASLLAKIFTELEDQAK